jgi:hypothetical protein
LANRLANQLEQVEATEAFKRAFQGKDQKLHSSYARDTAIVMRSIRPARPCPACGGKHEPSPDNDLCSTCGDRGYQTVEKVAEC